MFVRRLDWRFEFVRYFGVKYDSVLGLYNAPKLFMLIKKEFTAKHIPSFVFGRECVTQHGATQVQAFRSATYIYPPLHSTTKTLPIHDPRDIFIE